MNTVVTTPPTGLPVSWDSLKRRIVIDDPQEEAVVMEFAAEATAHAEKMMQCSLMTQRLTATFYDHHDAISHNHHFQYHAELPLRRGPIQSITSVKDRNGDNVTYTQMAKGHYDAIRLTQSHIHYPITVVYVAGFGDDPTDIPADILGAIRTDTTTRYAMREEYQPGTFQRVTNLDEFYRSRGRGVPLA